MQCQSLRLLILAALLVVFGSAFAQNDELLVERIEAHAINKPLPSLAVAGALAAGQFAFHSSPREVTNVRFGGRPLPTDSVDVSSIELLVQDSMGNIPAVVTGGFPGASNNDNGAVLGVLIAPPDTDGEVGLNHFVQMVNLLTTIYDKIGNIVPGGGPFPSNAIWSGIGGNCEPNNNGDPVVLYDDQADRWLVSQFAFPSDFSSFSQCVAISQTPDPTAGYHRYEFSFIGIGFNDYPKHGIVNDSITMMANLFTPLGGGSFSFAGTFLGVMDKNAMYAGNPATLIGQNVGRFEFGFVAGDLDGPGNSPALFATAMSRFALFDIWQFDIDWSTQVNSLSRVAAIPITPFDSDLCFASRETCVPQPAGPSLEALADRLMHRLQIRDFGTYRTMTASHTVDVDLDSTGNGRAGIRWYEMRETGGTWALHQEGTFGPDDGEHRWIPSAAMNAAGDIGIGYMVSSTNTFVSTAVAGQSAANSGTGILDVTETFCAMGLGNQLNTGRAGDYSATSIDPTDDSFWHTNEVFLTNGSFQWSTWVCNFTASDGNIPPTAAFSSSCTGLDCAFTDLSTDSDGTVDAWSWDFGDTNTSTLQNPSHTYAAAGTYSVTLTVTDDDGATDSVTQDVTVTEPANVAPTAAFSSSCTDLDCLFTDASTDSDGTVDAWSWDFGDTNTSTLQNPSHTYAAAGTYSVTLTVTDDDGATDSVTQDVTVTAANVAPTAAFSSSCTDLDCLFTDASTDSDGTVDAWSWDFGDTNTSTLQNPSHSYGAGGTFSVTLTVTDDDGATGSVTQDVTVTEANLSPTAAFSSSCTDLDCAFTDASTDSDGTVVSWAWAFGDGATSTLQNPSHSYGAGGTFSVTLTVTDDDGATGSVTQDVTVADPANDPPTAAFSSNCSNFNCAFTDLSTDSDGTVVAWAWDFGDGATSTLQNPSHSYPPPSTPAVRPYLVTLTVTDDDGATGSVTQSVNPLGGQNDPPTAAFSSSCTDLDCAFTDLSTDSDGTVVSWAWAFGDGATSTLQSPSHSYGAGGTFSVTLTVTDDDGATGSVTQDVTVTEANLSPTAAFSSSCTDLDCAFTDLSTDSDGTVVSWDWAFGDGATSTLQSPSHSYGAGGTFSVTLTVTDDDGATGSVTQDVTVTEANIAPTAAFSSSCTDLDCAFTDLSTDSDGTVVSWAWTFGDGATSTLQNPSHSYGAGGTFSVTLTVTDDDGATGSVTQDVTVAEANLSPTAAFSSSCTDLDCLFTDASSDSDGTVDVWSWDFGDTNTSTLQNPSHTYAAAGTYSVTLTVTDDDGATGSVTQDVTVTEANIAPTAAFSSSCTDLDCAFTDLSTDSDGTVVSWAWTFGDGATSTLQNPSHSYGAGGTFSVTLTVTDDDGATGSVTQDVTVTEANIAPTAAFSSSCTDLDCAFTDLSTDSDGTVVSWAWTFGDGATSTLQNPSHSYGAGGTFSVTLTVTDDDGATDSVTQDVTVADPANDPPTAAFSSNCSNFNCAFTDLSTDSDGTVVAWAWDFGDGATSTLQNPSHSYPRPSSPAVRPYLVTLTVTDNDGATDTISQRVNPF